MKNLNDTGIKTAFILTAVLCFFFFTGNTIAQEKAFYKAPAKKQVNMINNLKLGLKSENDGLRRCSVYLAGYYQINELVGTLAEQLNKTEDSKEKVMLLMALYKIGGDNSYKAIYDYMINTNDSEAKKLARTIMNEVASGSPGTLTLGR